MVAVSPAKAGAMLDGVSDRVVRQLICQGMLPAMEMFGKFKIWVNDIHDFLRTHRGKSITYADDGKTIIIE